MGKGLFGRIQDEVNAREKSPGITMADILTMPDQLRELIRWMMREVEVGLPQVSAYMAKDESAARSMIKSLVDQGFVREIDMKGVVRYRVRLAPKRKHNM